MREKLVAFTAVVFVIAGGAAGSYLAVRYRRTPPRTEAPKTVRTVKVRALSPDDVRVEITGYGTVRARDRVQVSPEVRGRVSACAPDLEVGRLVEKDAVMFALDERPFKLACATAQAEIDGLEAKLELLRASRTADKERLTVARRSSKLADRQYERVRTLLTEGKVGSESEVENAERAALRERELLLALEKTVALYDSQIREAEAGLAAARAALGTAELDLERATVRAPVAGRLDRVELEEGTVVTPGQVVAVVEATAHLEIAVPLEGKDLLWLPEGKEARSFEPAPARATWVQGSVTWPAVLGHLERYEERTRSAVVVFALRPASDGLRPEKGMFCRVHVDGRRARRVFRVPRDLVRGDRTVPLLRGGVLELAPVEILRWNGAEALISQGLKPGDLLVLSPLARAVPGTALEAAAE